MKNILLLISKIILSLVQIPLWFIKLFHGVGHMPNVDTGKIEEVHFYHTMFENISDLGYSFMFYISIALIILSLSFAIVSFIKKSNKVNLTSNIISSVSIVSFVIFLIIASTVVRGY